MTVFKSSFGVFMTFRVTDTVGSSILYVVYKVASYFIKYLETVTLYLQGTVVSQ